MKKKLKKTKSKDKLNLTKAQKDELYKEFKARQKKEEKLEAKRQREWDDRFENEPRGNHPSRPGRQDPGHDNYEDRKYR